LVWLAKNPLPFLDSVLLKKLFDKLYYPGPGKRLESFVLNLKNFFVESPKAGRDEFL